MSFTQTDIFLHVTNASLQRIYNLILQNVKTSVVIMGVWLFKDVVIQRIVQLYIDCLSLNVFYRNHLQVAVFFWWLYFMNKRTQDVDALVFLKNLTTWLTSLLQQSSFSGLKHLHNGNRVWGEHKQLNLSKFALSTAVEVANLIIPLSLPFDVCFRVIANSIVEGSCKCLNLAAWRNFK